MRRSPIPLRVLAALAATACGGHRAEAPPARHAAAAADRNPWADETRSPSPADSADRAPWLAALTRACGSDDGALTRVARRVAVELATNEAHDDDPEHVTRLLREEGEPHVRPRLTVVAGRPPFDEAIVLEDLERRRSDRTRCGVATATTADAATTILAAIAVDAVADLAPLPTRARPGQWLSFSAELHVATKGAKLLVLGPRGLPRTVPTTLDPESGAVRARFALDQPGAFDVQLVGDLDAGPTPLLEARVFADVEPSSAVTAAPGEGAARGDDAAALEEMTRALRASEGVPTLRRDAQLDLLARAHASAMQKAASVAHDVGDGDLVDRASAAGVNASVLGENVARAVSVKLAHRALYASPSHRLNLLRADYARLGLGVARAEDGVYVCEVFAR